jgi:hypothetical protein
VSAPKEILRLIDQFERNLDAYKSGQYNETQLRREFLDPFFKALGWDMDNAQGLAEAYKDVVNEDAIRIGGAVKAPDYCFRIGGTRKFFLEAKKPSVDIGGETSAAYQLRRYAWSAKLPLSILSDFEEFAVYDCRIKPNKPDSASTARVFICGFRDFPEKWDWISSIFSKDAVLKGSFDKYAETNKAKRGTAEVDDDFLATIEHWRSELARVLALRNSRLSQRELNFAVQRIIDRIIFLRISEDRGIEPYGRLLALTNGPNIYPRLCEIFEDADTKYNSGLFYFKTEKGRHEPPDELTLSLDVDDKLLHDLLKGLYYPESPYEFTVISSDILGHVYEQFLGKVIRLTAGHHAVVEDKPEVKKAGGVYYTPTYIVDYIVRQTVGKLVEDKTPKQVAKLRVLDPACGSGSFLINAYQFLLDWHRDWYLAHKPESWTKARNPVLVQTTSGWKLTIAERKRILLDNIYGVDIDPQAVEVTKLSLLLKVLEGESEQTIQPFLRLFQQRALPDLGDNIKCGNSLIGPDFYSQKELPLLSDDDRLRINVFDWDAEFPEIMKSGGFDAVIGNPPYGATIIASEAQYLRMVFGDESQSRDTYELFLLQASKLLNSSGRLAMIVPASYLTGDKYQMSRRFLLSFLSPLVAYAMPFDVFKDAYIDTAIVVLAHSSVSKNCLINYFPKKERLCSIPDGIGKLVPIKNIREDPLKRLSVALSLETAPILSKLKTAKVKFGDWFNIQRGVQPYSRKKHSEEQIAQRFLHAESRRSKEYLPELQGNELSRYWIEPKRVSYIRFCDDIASNRPIRMFQGERIVLRRLLTRKFRLQASVTSETMITTDNVLNLVPKGSKKDVLCALGFLNSRLISWLYINTSMVAQKDDFPQVHISALASLPIPEVDKKRHGQVVTLVDQMLNLHKQLPQAKTPHEKESFQRQIMATDRNIDQLVYQLYGLSTEEIKIVEDAD